MPIECNHLRVEFFSAAQQYVCKDCAATWPERPAQASFGKGGEPSCFPGEAAQSGSDGAVILQLQTIDEPFEPDWASPPGDTIEDFVEELQLDRQKVAELLGMSRYVFELLIKGREVLTDELAEKLAAKLGSTAEFWKAREKQYRDSLSRLVSKS